MRKIINMQMEFWKKDIGDIEFDLRSRDEITKLLIGLQHISGLLTSRNFNCNLFGSEDQCHPGAGVDV